MGRARLDTGSGSTGWSNGFGLHAVFVNSSSRRVHAECIRVDEVEAAVSEKLQRVYHEARYDAFMDFNSGHWVATHPTLTLHAHVPLHAGR